MTELKNQVSEDRKLLVDQMKSIIERCIASQGNTVKIALDDNTDKKNKRRYK